MKSFRSFKEISGELLNIENILENPDKYFAHTHQNEPKETLIQHTQKVKEWTLILIETHHLDLVANKLIYSFTYKQNYISNFGNLIKKIFFNAIVFHDFGKVNPNFQVEKMKNEFFNPDKEIKINTKHSILSAYIFLNFHFEKILEMEKFSDEEKNILYAITILFSNPILKHHSGYLEQNYDFRKTVINSLYKYLSQYKIDFQNEISNSFFENIKLIFDGFDESLKTDNYFSLYALLKLNYSLLTASDYYATSEYMNDFKINDFGLIDSKLRNQIIYSFENNPKKPYNKELKQNPDKFLNIKFSELQERNNINLNILRQKLGVEAILNLKKNPNKKLFYLEAPTGAGKTNVSIAFATELLQIDKKINKIFYIFPFTTLITQTFQSIKDTIDISDEHIIQLHSKAGFHSKENEEGTYGKNYRNYINNLFVNYPITLLSHIKFFNILKGNSKKTNYILHRLANSIVIIDELQSYTPKHWDKVIFFLDNYAKYFNVRFLIMSATLPKIDELNDKTKGKIVRLTPNRNQYFLNPNFKNRISFDFQLLDWEKPVSDKEKQKYLQNLSNFVFKKLEVYAEDNHNKIRGLIEFITKKSATKFQKIINNKVGFDEYKKYLISGEILESRRKFIIDKIKENADDKVIVITTQVIETGVDIDMDIGFKDRSLIDSDEQLAGRINREAKRDNCKLYLFDFDKTFWIYKNDYRYNVQSKEDEIYKNYKQILEDKTFDKLYEKVYKNIKKRNNDAFNSESEYFSYFKTFNFKEINQKFRLIEQENESVFIPLSINKKYFNTEDLKSFNIKSNKNGKVSGEDVFQVYMNIIDNKEQKFIKKNINLKKLAGIISQFMISIFHNQKKLLKEYCDIEKEKYGISYLLNWKDIYSYEGGFNIEKINGDIFL
jgi:CRISPR-associated endonuclease/helicase Cas3